ncbi:MAG: MmgE/PrpD family protein [Chloroflexia bacterium]|nr:MmgE/PrpD family protein [Chloroflexia bacterium]
MLTFHQATRLASRRPTTTEEAQYSLPFPVAAALVHGQLGLAQLSGAGLGDPDVLRFSDQIELVDDPALSARFPAERIARVRIETAAGKILDSGETAAPWDAATPPTDEELIAKFRWVAGESLTAARVEELIDLIWNCADLADAGTLVASLASSSGASVPGIPGPAVPGGG